MPADLLRHDFAEALGPLPSEDPLYPCWAGALGAITHAFRHIS